MFKNSDSGGQPYSLLNKSLKIWVWTHEQTLAIVKKRRFCHNFITLENCKKKFLCRGQPLTVIAFRIEISALEPLERITETAAKY
jgi:hypothetical protein